MAESMTPEERKTRIAELKKEIGYFDPQAALSEHDAEERYNDLLDDIYPEVCIAEMCYPASRTLKAIDPVAYRCGMSVYFACIDPEDFPNFPGYNELVEELEELEAEELKEGET